jgi:hypothetical protein
MLAGPLFGMASIFMETCVSEYGRQKFVGSHGGRAALEDDDAARMVREAGRVLERSAGGERESVRGHYRVARAGHVDGVVRADGVDD